MKINQPFALNEVGGRQNQEDSIFPAKGDATSEDRFFLVCDGMGGHENGEVASNTVCQSFADFLNKTDLETFDKTVFEQALSYAYDRLDEKDTDTAGRKMGTTLTFLTLNSRGALMAHIGDSRIYQLRKTPAGAEIIYKSRDHSLVNDLVEANIITPEEALSHPKKNVITRAMQPHLDKRCDATLTETADVRTGDYFFLCSDGVLESVGDQQLMEIIAADTTAEQKIEAVRTLCQDSSRDNFSAYLVEIAEGIFLSKQPPVVLVEPVLQPPVEPVLVVEQPAKKRNVWLKSVVVVLVLLSAILVVWFAIGEKKTKEETPKPKQTEQVPAVNSVTPKPEKPTSVQPEEQKKLREQQNPIQSQQKPKEPVAGKDKRSATAKQDTISKSNKKEEPKKGEEKIPDATAPEQTTLDHNAN